MAYAQQLPLALASLVLAALPTRAQDDDPRPSRSSPIEMGAASEALARDFAQAVESAHGLAAWRAPSAVQARIVVRFGGTIVVDGEMLLHTDMSASRLDLADNSVAVYDGKDAWVSPSESAFKNARFHALTWPYFLSAPMKLRDAGAQLQPIGDKRLRGRTFSAARLTFRPGVGDTPDDWYILYRDRITGRLAAMAYIVTYGKTRQQAEREPHAVTFPDLDLVGAVAASQSGRRLGEVLYVSGHPRTYWWTTRRHRSPRKTL